MKQLVSFTCQEDNLNIIVSKCAILSSQLVLTLLIMFKKIGVQLNLSSVAETKLNTITCSFIISHITVITALQVVWDISFVLSGLNCMAFYLVPSVQTSQHGLPSVSVSLMPSGLIQSDAALGSTEVGFDLDVLVIFLVSLENRWISDSWLSNCTHKL